MSLLKPSNLHPYQVQAYKDIVRDKVFCITDDCGGGKTIIGLTAHVVIKRKRPKSIMLAVCKPSGVKGAWSNEYKKWSHTKDLKVAVLNGSPKQRLKLLKEQVHSVYAISYNSLGWLAEAMKEVDFDFDFVYGDEGDCLKGPDSQWRKDLINCAPKAKFRILASATPKAKEEDDYWGLCKYLDNGKCLNASTVSEFRQQYCSSYTFKGRTIYTVKPSEIKKLESNIKHLFRNYGDKDAVKIPIKTICAYTNLSPSSLEKYEMLKTEACVNSIVFNNKGKIDDSKSLDAMTLNGKLNELSSGFLYVDDNLRITPEMLSKTTNVKQLIKKSKKRLAVDVFDDRKVALKKMIKTVRKRHGKIPLVICYNFKHELTQLQEMLPNGVADTEENIEARWNNDEIPYLFLQYNRSSKSLNLQYSSGYVLILYTSTYSWVDDYQIIRRLARQGQKAKCVYAYRIMIRGTVDDAKATKLNSRFKGHKRFQKQIIQEIFG